MSNNEKTTLSALRRNRFRLLAVCIIVFMAVMTYPSFDWVRRQMKWRLQRADAIAWMTSQAEFWSDLPVDQKPILDVPAPTPLQYFGTPGLRTACVVVANKNDVDRKQNELKALFPEATEIVVVSPGPGYTGIRSGIVNR